MKRERMRNVVLALFASAFGASCGETQPATAPFTTGGAPVAPISGGSGGAATGGSTAGGSTTGGTATGGTATGGSTTGGTATGGVAVPTTGGMATGGVAPNTGGFGFGKGGMSQGGEPGSGGTATGGATAGSSGSAGTPSNPPTGDPDPSPGCGSAPTGVCDEEASPCTANGLDYYIDMPEDYDQNRPYPVVFQYHPLGGSAQGARNMYRVRPIFMDAIYVSPEGSDNGFPNSGGVDEEMTRSIMETIETNLCVDRARYFATGFSYGGSMSYTAACNMSDKFRAVAAMAGAPISGARCTSMEPARPVAILGIHGEEDTALPITLAEPIIETWLEKNGCSGEPQPSDLLGSDCATMESALQTGAYGCMAGYPVIWCPIPGYPHNIPSWSPDAIAAFFMQF